MSTKIYWFSGTGNSLSVAKTLAEKLPDADLIPMAKAIQNPPEAADRIGLVFPVYAFGPPAMVERFIAKLKAPPDVYLFSVCTCAVTSGTTTHFVKKMLRRRGLDLAALWTVKQPENYPPLGGTPDPKSQLKTQTAAAASVDRIADDLQWSPCGLLQKAGLFWRTAGLFIYPAFRWFERHGADRFFRADSKCNGCGLCAKICPVQNIEMKRDRPEWRGHCEQCFACFHWCPQKAVQYGLSSRLRRYHHPRTSLADFRDHGSRLQNL